jgi:glutathione S-transferase
LADLLVARLVGLSIIKRGDERVPSFTMLGSAWRSMFTLHGFSASNYYNVVKLALLEKGLPFREALVWPGAGKQYRPEYLDQSPLGKVPCLETDDGFITESRCIVDYLERAFPEPPLYPTGTFHRAKMMELTQFIDLYIELPARRLLRNLFSGKPPPEAVASEVRQALENGVRALRKLARFETFLLGDRFTAADIAGAMHFPAVQRVTQAVLDCDPLDEIPGLSQYVQRMDERPTIKQVREDRDKIFPDFIDYIRSRFAR